MKRFQVTCFSYLLIIVLATFLLGSGIARAATPLSCGSWNVVSSPNAGLDDILYGVVPVPGTNQFWAVGRYDGSNGFYQALTERWNGNSWSVISSPDIGNSDNILNGVAVVSANDVWAVGLYNSDGVNPGLTLTEHWNGTSWSIIPSQNPTNYNFLNAVSGASANDVWTVGEYETSNGVYHTLIEHWNGTIWSITASPSPGSYDTLQGVTAISANDAWAVGSYYDASRQQQLTLIKHWNGSSWSIVSSPSVGTSKIENNYLLGVTAIPGNASNIWAVGKYYNPGTPHGYQTLIEHWNGSTWSVVKSPDPGGNGGNPILYAVTADSQSDAWAVGYLINPNSAYLTLTIHWNGSTWSVVPSPSPGGMMAGDASVLYGVAAISTHNVQAVGYYQTGYFIPTTTLAEAYC